MAAKTPAPQGEIHLTVPPRIHAKLAELAGFRTVEDWVRSVIIRAAEEVEPPLTRSSLWRGDVSAWCADAPEKD